MKRTIAALCAGTALLGGADLAGGHASSTATTVSFMGTAREPEDTYRAFGDLLTTRKCRANRRVKIFFEYVTKRRTGPAPPEWTLVDVDRTSRNGMWGGSGPIGGEVGGVNAVKVRAVRKNVGPRGHRHICRGDTLIQMLA